MKKNLRLLVRSAILLCLSSLVFSEFDQNLVADQMMSASAAAPQRRSARGRSRTRRSRRPRRERSAATQRPAFDRILTENRSLLDQSIESNAGIGAIDDHTLRAHIRFLADDLLEGRGTGTRGGLLAARYIAAQFEALGLEPACADGSYFQSVQMVGSRTDPSTRLNLKSAAGALDLAFATDFVAGSDLEKAEIPIEGDLLFVGYGISSAENNWDDYKGLDVRGKILVMLVNDPPPTPAEPELFGGKALTYYGRWTYKFEEAARRGAAGAILIHSDQAAGYHWSVVRNSWTGERFSLLPDTSTPSLKIKAWVTEDSARRIFQLGGQNLDQLREAALSRNFQPAPVSVQLSTSLHLETQRITSPNVVAIYRGSDPNLKKQFVAYSAHWDHLGIRADQPGDNIYNGAVDNATGIAGILALARAYATSSLKPRRSIIFIATTAEEQGLLGAEYYLGHPLVPVAETVANINLDSLNVFGLTTDISPLGGDRSPLGAVIEVVAKENNLTVSPESNPEQGGFYRSDHFPFAKAGIPAVSLQSGNRFVGHSESWVAEQRTEFSERYHQPSDEYNPHWDLSGMVQQVRIAFAIGLRVATGDGRLK
jgi:Zn-dependent M28 family amino/carboxypeptidase